MAKARTPRHESTANPSHPEQDVSPEERRHMIEEAAYFRAQQRDFRPGDPVDDWLAAEREVNRMLPSPQQQKQELAAYDKLRQGVRNILGEARENLNAETIRDALAQSVTQLKQLGEYTADTVDKVAASVEKDMASAAQRIGTRWENISEKTSDLFHVWRDRSSQFLGHATRALGDWLQQTSTMLKPQLYHSGDMAAEGTLECTACGERLVLRTAAHLPACSKCRNREFRRLL